MDIWVITTELDDNVADKHGAWRRQPLGSGLDLLHGCNRQVSLAPVSETTTAKLASIIAFGDQRAALLTSNGAEVRLNGSRPLPVAVLADRDEITVLGTRLRFAAFTDTIAYVLDIDGLRCARCKNAIKRGAVVRACPACSALYHSGEDLEGADPEVGASPPCYDYEPKCRTCASALASVSRTPEDQNADVL